MYQKGENMSKCKSSKLASVNELRNEHKRLVVQRERLEQHIRELQSEDRQRKAKKEFDRNFMKIFRFIRLLGRNFI